MNGGLLNELLAANGGFLYGFLTWFKAFFGNMLDGIWTIFKGIFFGIGQIFDFSYYFKLWSDESVNFGALDWILSVLSFILVIAVWVGIVFLIILGIRKIARFKKALSANEDLLEEIADLNKKNAKLSA